MSSSADSVWRGTLNAKTGTDADLCAFAQRMPQVKATKSGAETSRREKARIATMKLINHCMRNPDAAIDFWATVDSGLAGAPAAPQSSSCKDLALPAEKKVGKPTFGKLTAEHMTMVYMHLGVSDNTQLFDRMYDKGPHAIGDIFVMHFQVGKSDKIPDNMQDPSVFCKAMRRRAEELGHRHMGWFKISVDAEGTVDWTKRPLYNVYWHEGKVATIEHIGGDKISIPAHCTIDESYHFMDPFSDDTARFVYGATTHFIKDFFGRDSGPNKSRLDRHGSHMKALAATTAQEIEAKKAEVKALLDTPEDVRLTQRQKRLREDALLKARSALGSAPKRGRSFMLTASGAEEEAEAAEEVQQ